MSNELIEAMARAMTPLLCCGQEDALGRPLPDKALDDLPPDWQARFEDYAQAAYAAIADRIEALEAENEKLQARADAARREALEEASKVARDYASKAAQRGWVLKPGSIVTAARHIATTIRALKENPNAG